MNCPECGAKTGVRSTQYTKSGLTTRRRICTGPDHHHFTTVEAVVTPGLVNKAGLDHTKRRIVLNQVPIATWLDGLQQKGKSDDH